MTIDAAASTRAEPAAPWSPPGQASGWFEPGSPRFEVVPATPGRDAGEAPDMFHHLGHITRQLHDLLTELGVMSKLQHAADGLPDARSRLNYIAQKTGEAADRVLTSVEQARLEHKTIALATRRMAQTIVDNPAIAVVASAAVIGVVADIEAATARVDRHLTDIMLAQDFHDLTGQVVTKVITLAAEIEDGLVSLLVRAAPGASPARAETGSLNGPVIGPHDRTDVVANQGDVDDLLASMGF